ncbi:MAG: hypothetical protein M1838_005216 [Thelocarpon superellum]|nr:MAG: hypothetical protein M1838_005216 [Thelocarpon superellum]
MAKAVLIGKIDGKPGQVYYPLKLVSVPTPTPSSSEVVVRISHAALNHRDLFLRQHLYPGITFDVPLLADGCGTVVSTGSAALNARWKGNRVILTPSRGWDRAPEGPEQGATQILGGTKGVRTGTLQEYVVVDASEVEEAPEHLSGTETAALPLTGLTAWRALFTKSGNAIAGRNILVTGIGGGVALNALQFATAAGCNVYVTSGSADKLQKAKDLGATGGVSYKDEGWDKELLKLLPTDRPFLDAVIDGAGGNVLEKTVKILKHGGVIVSYGMTLGPKMPWPMSAVMKNIEIRGSTMGSRAEFGAMMDFVRTRRIRPVVSRVVQGIDNLDEIDGLFDDMKSGRQFGKLVIEIMSDDEASRSRL